MSTTGPEASAAGPAVPPRARVSVRDPALAAAVGALGYAAADDPADVVVVVATTVDQAREAQARGRCWLLHLGADGAAEHLEATGRVECVFGDAAGLCERLEWLEGHGWTPPARPPRRVELAARMVEARAWLAAVREAERTAQAAHDEEVALRSRHQRALEDHRDHLIERIAQMDAQLHATDRERLATQARLDAILGSRLWRMLAPLRAIRRLVASRGRGGRP